MRFDGENRLRVDTDGLSRRSISKFHQLLFALLFVDVASRRRTRDDCIIDIIGFVGSGYETFSISRTISVRFYTRKLLDDDITDCRVTPSALAKSRGMRTTAREKIYFATRKIGGNCEARWAACKSVSVYGRSRTTCTTKIAKVAYFSRFRVVVSTGAAGGTREIETVLDNVNGNVCTFVRLLFTLCTEIVRHFYGEWLRSQNARKTSARKILVKYWIFKLEEELIGMILEG